MNARIENCTTAGNTDTGILVETQHFEDGERVYPCRCGEVHRGPYAVYDYGHHNCFHDEPLAWLEDTGQCICPQCGMVFSVA